MEKPTVQACLSINADEAINELKRLEEAAIKIRETINMTAGDLKEMRKMAELDNPKDFVTLNPTIQIVTNNNCDNGYDIDTIIKRISSQLEEEIASTSRKALIFEDAKINAYDTDIIVEELVNVLKSRGITIGEAERILDKAKAELSYVRLVSDHQITSA